jgi:hypothetical protein
LVVVALVALEAQIDVLAVAVLAVRQLKWLLD